MKYIYILIVALVSNLSFSQDARLFEDYWYLQNIVIDGVDNLPPEGLGYLAFMQDTSEIAGGGICNAFSADCTFSESNPAAFSLTNTNGTFMGCPEVFDYDSMYLSFYFQNVNFTYDIAQFNEMKILTIYAGNTRHIFDNVVLSTVESQLPQVKIYPNPASDYLSVALENPNLKNAQIEIYNRYGQLCSTQKITSSLENISVQRLPSGIYMAKIKTDTGTIIKKWIKL